MSVGGDSLGSLKVEQFSSNDVVSSLWNKNAAEKCRIGLADILIYENGLPVRWYVTGKAGEVTKKRGVDWEIITPRWLNIANRYDSPFVAIVRQDGGVLKFLSEEAWEVFRAEKADPSVLSVHCFINGDNHIVYRNKFELRDKLGRYQCSTHSYSFDLPKDSTSSVITFYENKTAFIESKAQQIRNIMDLATNTLVRYMETMLQVKILTLSVDYIIDKKSQIWMMWSPECSFMRTTRLEELNLPGSPDKTGRMAWAGAKYFESIEDNADSTDNHEGAGSPDIGRSTAYSPNRSRATTPHGTQISTHVASAQVTAAVSVVKDGDPAKQHPQQRRHKNENAETYIISAERKKKAADMVGSFPQPFKCKGDYCHFNVAPTGVLHPKPEQSSDHIAQKLFSKQELMRLRKDKNFSQMFEFGADGPALAALTMKSILLARQERRGLAAKAESAQSWNEYPESPRGQINFSNNALGVASSTSIDMTATASQLNEDTEQLLKEEVLHHDKEQRNTFSKSMSRYYEQVRVCGNCYNIYQCLDWARDILGQGDAYGAGRQGQGAAHPKRIRGGRRSEPSGALGAANSGEEGNPNPSYAAPTAASTHGQSDLRKERSESALLTQNKPRSRGGLMHTTSLTSTSYISREDLMHQQRTDQAIGPRKNATWKSHLDKRRPDRLSKSTTELNRQESDNEFVQLDDYLRGGAQAIAQRKARERSKVARTRFNNYLQKTGDDDDLGVDLEASDDENLDGLYRGEILLACIDNEHCQAARDCLEDAHFIVHCAKDGRDAVNKFTLRKDGYDCVLVQRDLPLFDAFTVVREVRKYELSQRRRAAAYAATQGRGVQPHTRRHPVICYTDETSPSHLKAFMEADMDGCVSYPLNNMSLLNTVRAAIPQHLAPMPPPDEEEQHAAMLEAQKNQPKVYRMGALGEIEGSTDSATMAVKTLPAGGGSVEDDVAFNGVVQIDADTRLPFMVLDASRTAKVLVNPKKPFFNLIVCHDLFDTAEKMKIFLRPMVQRYLGMQVLLWNYPGQAFTEWREEQLLNNEYLATCLNEVLGQVGEHGTKDFDTTRPFYMLGFGNGASIATFYASHYRVPNLRGLLSVNGWSFVDSYLAGVMHDCINIFQCAPPTRPDLPLYFFSRFLFSKEYLAKVSVPLALNIYTAVHNSISVVGRLNLCKGVLQSVDVRPLLKEIDCPVICIHSTQDALARPLHTEPFVHQRSGEVRSIHRVLKEPRKTCVIWVKGGHEVFQENKRQVQLMIEQILTGFHESHDITFPSAQTVDPAGAAQGKIISNLPWENNSTAEKTVEDKFIDNVLGSMSKLAQNTEQGVMSMRAGSSGKSGAHDLADTFPSSRVGTANSSSPNRTSSPYTLSHQSKNISFSATDPSSWQEYSQVIADSQILSKSNNKDIRAEGRGSRIEDSVKRVIDPNSAMFERQDNPVYGTKAVEIRRQQDVHDFPEVKEYMTWRLKRNKKRLQRLQGAARQIQGAFRAFMARRLVQGLRRLKAAMLIQRVFRGWRGRCRFKNRARAMWATQVLQRAWRGYISRKWYFYMRLRIAAATNIQRMYRGHRARLRVAAIHRQRYHAAATIQAMFRRFTARKLVWRMRQFRNCSTAIQRIFRGHLGRKRAIAERDKYIFSRSQSQGIEFGRQMLLEHKLHATRLQSDVTLLTQEKVAAEEQIEALLEEISTFEEGVRTLEKEMHQLSKVESEAAAFMDEDSKFELREQKMKLDREFGEMLSKISTRKDMLDDLEKKLSTIDKSRQSKEEELRTLERKLVVLLEEQQNELNAIKRKQDIRGAMLAASHEELMKVSAGDGEGSTPSRKGGAGGGGHSGPSLQEKKQAAQLMQSTETLMKFGFMSMSMTYFSSLNMVKALRTVSAQDTVMAALSDVHAQRAAGYTGVGGGSEASAGSLQKEAFVPDLKPGQLPGQQMLRVSAWSVEDVAKWLQTLSLGQYSEAFIDSAVDGEFLYDLNDDDLKNTLGIEHRLHRKKILNCVHRLKVAEAQKDSRLNELLRDSGGLDAPTLAPDVDEAQNFPANPFADGAEGGESLEDRLIEGPRVPLDELMSLVRHSKLTAIKDAIDYLPNKNFDKALVQAAYVPDHGTVYVAGYDRLPFHMNKTDEFGNSMLSHACQNGNIKICKYLVGKGCNPNHQNRNGQTPAHFAIAYKFFDLSEWLFENGADDTIENKYGLTAYDGLSIEGADD